VWERMREVGSMLGGEQAGHIIFGEFSSTGDGLVTALQVLQALMASGKPLSELGAGLVVVPQVTRDIVVSAKPSLDGFAEVTGAVGEAQAALADRGRVILRYSGTEPLARVMVEGEDEAYINEAADNIADAIRACVPGPDR